MSLPPLIPKEVLFGNPERMCVRVSPDGKLVGYIAPHDGVLNVWVRSVAGGDDHPVTNDRHRGIREFFWPYDGKHLCYIQDKDGDENWHIYAINLETGQSRDITPYEGVQAQPTGWEPQRPNEILVGLNKENPELFDYYIISLDTGECELAARNPDNIVDVLPDSHLNIVGGLVLTENGGSEILHYCNGEWRSLLRAPFGETIHAFGLTPDDKAFYISSTLDSNTSRVLTLDIETGGQTVVAGRDNVDFDGEVLIHPTRKHLQAASFTYAKKEWVFLDSELEADFERASKLDEGVFDLVSRDLGNRVWVTAFSQDVCPVKYYLYHRETGQGEYLFSADSRLESYTLAPMQPVVIQARDGLNMVCYLTLPAGVEPKSLPLVLDVHGGPWARNIWGLDREAQWLANRGYAVLQVNYRGSTGFGKDYVNASIREWGGKMHDDLIDAVNWAVQQGYADPEKVVIYGWSYGGYSALVGMTFTPEVFAAGMAGVGISNLVSWAKSLPPYWEPFREMLDRRVGNPERDEEFLKSRSPLFRADKIRKPLMIVQGANDPRVPKAESDQIVEAVKANGGQVEYLLYEDEGHGLVRPENRLHCYSACEKFLSGVLGGRAEEE